MATQHPEDDNFHFDASKLSKKQQDDLVKQQEKEWKEKEVKIAQSLPLNIQFEYRKHANIVDTIRRDQLAILYKELLLNYMVKDNLLRTRFNTNW